MQPWMCCHSLEMWLWSLCQSAAASRQVGTLLPCMGVQLLERSADVLLLLRGLQACIAAEQPPRSAHLS